MFSKVVYTCSTCVKCCKRQPPTAASTGLDRTCPQLQDLARQLNHVVRNTTRSLEHIKITLLQPPWHLQPAMHSGLLCCCCPIQS
jgi:hypothetical protein